MPINMQFGTMNFKDVRDPEQTMEFYRRYVAEKELEITTAPLSVKAIKDLVPGPAGAEVRPGAGDHGLQHAAARCSRTPPRLPS